ERAHQLGEDEARRGVREEEVPAGERLRLRRRSERAAGPEAREVDREAVVAALRDEAGDRAGRTAKECDARALQGVGRQGSDEDGFVLVRRHDALPRRARAEEEHLASGEGTLLQERLDLAAEE